MLRDVAVIKTIDNNNSNPSFDIKHVWTRIIKSGLRRSYMAQSDSDSISNHDIKSIKLKNMVVRSQHRLQFGKKQSLAELPLHKFHVNNGNSPKNLTTI